MPVKTNTEIGTWCEDELRRLAGTSDVASVLALDDGVVSRCFELCVIAAVDSSSLTIDELVKLLPREYRQRFDVVKAELLAKSETFNDISDDVWDAFGKIHPYPDQLVRFAKLKTSYDKARRRDAALVEEDKEKRARVIATCRDYGLDARRLSSLTGVKIDDISDASLKELDAGELHRLAIACIQLRQTLTKPRKVKRLVSLDSSIASELDSYALSHGLTKSCVAEDALRQFLTVKAERLEEEDAR